MQSWFAAVPILCLLLSACAAPARTLTVSAAANMQGALNEIALEFEKNTGTHVAINYGSTGTLAQQIAQGAPVALFIAADRSSIEGLAARGVIIPDTVRLYARGQIVIYTTRASAIAALADLASPEIQRIAIANPETAPYGAAARQAMQNAGVWNAAHAKIVYGENIQQVLQYADTSNVDAAIIARAQTIGAQGKWTLIPQNLYSPIDQTLGVVTGAQNERAARDFAAMIAGAYGRAVLVKYGYDLP